MFAVVDLEVAIGGQQISNGRCDADLFIMVSNICASVAEEYHVEGGCDRSVVAET